MNIGEIAERFIRAAEIERRMPQTGERPRQFGGYVLPFVHSAADVNGWGRRHGDFLHPGDDPLDKDWRWAWLDERNHSPSPADVTDWEQCLKWTAEMLDDPGQRRSLWMWAFSKAGKGSFARWCRTVEHIHRNTGIKRKNRALDRILAQLSRSATQHCEEGPPGELQVAGQIGHVSPTIPGVYDTEPAFAWRDSAFRSFLTAPTDDEFDWARKRNERRRQQEAKRRKEAA